MRLDELLDGLDTLDHHNLFGDMDVDRVVSDSRKVVPGSVFVAIQGTRFDGHKFIAQALAAGASVIVQNSPIIPESTGSYIRVSDSREAYAVLNARLHGNPSHKIRVIGVTGTNGKTSTALLLAHLLNSGGMKAAVLGTLGLLRPGDDNFVSSSLTTPDAADLQQLMARLSTERVTHLVMEVSSHAIAQHRIAGVNFVGAVFTNLSQDHFDFHETMEDYAAAKERLFSEHVFRSGGYSVINCDDEFGAGLAERTNGLVLRYGKLRKNNLVITETESSASGVNWKLVLKNGVWPTTLEESNNLAVLSTKLAGDFQIYNCTAATGVALLEGLDLNTIQQAFLTFRQIPGRLESVRNDNGIYVYVDYAHTPDAVENVLRTLGKLRTDDSRLITVVGCGGDRDSGKRPQMGRIAQQGSDIVIFTSDNPRTENPDRILDDMYSNLDSDSVAPVREADRRKAIRWALTNARRSDIVLIAGKGHEDYQILKDRTIHFSDTEEVRRFFSETAEING